jgi:EAL domain-containing protein (putative c-di-GMP-specific phosphodiesterase class I)
MIMEDAEYNVDVLGRLKELGVQVAVDDFGTGYSNLAYLKRFPMDMLKVDKSFVNGLGEKPEDTAIVEAVISLARALGLRTVAEGIETSGQLERLRDLGCELGQGYYFSRALPADEASALLVAPAGHLAKGRR